MNTKSLTLVVIALFSLARAGRADFKYTETSKITGGMMAGMMKFAGAFSKDARKANGPMESTTSVKGNRMRRDEATGKAQIIDLDGRRMIEIDPQKRTYSVVTFDQMKTAIEQARAKAEQSQQKANAKNPNANVKMVPKIETSQTGNTKTILNQPTQERKVRVDMEMQSDDPQYKGQSASFWFTSDAWVAPTLPGYEEVQQFNLRMAKELDWVPGAMFGATPQMAPSMEEFRKTSAQMKGFPLLQNASFGMAGTGQPAGAGSGQAPSSAETRSNDSQSSGQVSNPGDAAAKALGGMFGGLGGFGRKKKQTEDQPAQNDQNPSATASSSSSTPPASSSNTSSGASLMDMSIEVTSFSSDKLDSSIFEIPAGYTEVQQNPDQVVGGARR
jgi:hypothetical protein